MAWTSSEVFRAWFKDCMDRTAAFDMNTDAFLVALFNDTITPNQDAAAADTAYNAGVWLTAAEETGSAGQWDAGGESLPNPTINAGTAGVVFWDGDNVVSGATATIADAYGCLVYDDTLTTPVANQGVCFNYFGGANSVTSGTFTINWAANGIWRATL